MNNMFAFTLRPCNIYAMQCTAAQKRAPGLFLFLGVRTINDIII